MRQYLVVTQCWLDSPLGEQRNGPLRETGPFDSLEEAEAEAQHLRVPRRRDDFNGGEYGTWAYVTRFNPESLL